MPGNSAVVKKLDFVKPSFAFAVDVLSHSWHAYTTYSDVATEYLVQATARACINLHLQQCNIFLAWLAGPPNLDTTAGHMHEVPESYAVDMTIIQRRPWVDQQNMKRRNQTSGKVSSDAKVGACRLRNYYQAGCIGMLNNYTITHRPPEKQHFAVSHRCDIVL